MAKPKRLQATWRHAVRALSRAFSRALNGPAGDGAFVEAPLRTGPGHGGEGRPAAVVDVYPLSPFQHAMLVQARQVQRLGMDIEQVVYELREDLDVPAFRRAWQCVVRRHPILRTGFREEGADGPRQEVHGDVVVPWGWADWRRLAAGERRSRLEAYLRAERLRGFDLAAAPAMRFALIREGRRLYRFCWTVHHLIFDGRTGLGLFKEVFACYEALRRGEAWECPPAPSYRGYIDWLQAQDASRSAGFWRAALAGFRAPTPPPAARPSALPLDPAHTRGEQTATLSREITAALKAWARAHRMTLNTLLHGAWALLLGRYSGEPEVVFGAVRACRRSTPPGAAGVAGPCLNTVPIRVRVADDAPLPAWLNGLRDQWAGLRDHEHTPLARIQTFGEVPPDTPLFETAVNYQGPSWNAALRAQGGAWQDRDLRLHSQPSMPLVLDASCTPELELKLLYDRRRFEDAAVARMLGHVKTLLEGMAENPERPLAALPLLTEAERLQALSDAQSAAAEYPAKACIHELFEAQAARLPDAVALECGEQSMTYGELNRQANQLAHHLRAQGVKAGDVVGLCTERSLRTVVGLLGILKAGGAYLALDPDYPRERLALLLGDARPAAVVTQERLAGRLPAAPVPLVLLDADEGRLSREDKHNPSAGAAPDGLAYVTYTSGSTGVPKGVLTPHRAVARLLFGVDYVRLDDRPTVAHLAPLSFDASTFEVWAPLLHGGRCVLGPHRVPAPSELGEFLKAHRVDTLWLTSSLFNVVIDTAAGALSDVRQLLIGGEALSPAHIVRALRLLPHTEICNGYGPTEATTFACCYRIPRDFDGRAASVPIGRPIGNTQAYVLDPAGRFAPVGVAGELYLGGDGLARGYLNREELTREKFVPDPFRADPAARLYRTGDRARRRADGNLEFLGRLDAEVKVRGFRIDLGEIEAALARRPDVRQAAAAVWEPAPGDRRLVAYASAGPGAVLTPEQCRTFLAETLPSHMIPAVVVVLEALPLSANGKVDRKALPPPNRGDAPRARREARTATEEVVAGVWRDVLKVDGVGPDDNYFDLGGDSLLAAMTTARLGQAFQLDLPGRLLFERPTVAELSEAIDGLRAAGGGAMRPTPAAAPRGRSAPLSLFQERIWDYCRAGGDPLRFVSHIDLDLKGALDPSALQRALTELARRHDVLRTTVAEQEGEPVQVVGPAVPAPLPVVDLGGAGDFEACADRISQEEALLPFDLTLGPLFRARLLRRDGEHHRFLFTLHALLYDGSLREQWFTELRTLYEAFRAGEPSPLREPGAQYVDFAVWQRAALRKDGELYREQVAYWKRQLGDDPPAPDLPFKRSRPASPDPQDARRTEWLEPGLRQRVHALARQEGATAFMVLLAAFQGLLHRYAGNEDLVAGTYVANRTRPEFDSVIGLKTNLLLLRTSLTGDQTFLELLRRVRRTCLDAFAHQDIPFEELSRALQAEGRGPLHHLVRAIFQYQAHKEEWLGLPGVTETLVERAPQSMPWGFSFFVMEVGERMKAGVYFDADLYEPAPVHQFVSDYAAFLRAAAAHPGQRLASLPMGDMGR